MADPGIAQDVAQEVFLRLWRHPALFDVTRGRFVSWLISVARNRAVDEVRSRGRRRLREVMPAPGADSARSTGRRSTDRGPGDIRDEIRRALAPCTEEQRVAIENGFFGGMTEQEIASVLATPLGTVKTRVRLAMKKLRLSLERPLGRETVS